MEKINATLVENATRYNQPSSLDFIVFDDNMGYAVGSDYCVYQVLDFNPAESGEQANWLVYSDDNGIFFNYAEDGKFSDFLRRYDFDVEDADEDEFFDLLEDADEDEVFDLLSESCNLDDFMTNLVKSTAENRDKA